MRVAAYQGRCTGRLTRAALAQLERAAPDVLVLPEYFLVPPEARSHREAAGHAEAGLRHVEEVSRRLGAVVAGGSFVERDGSSWYNSSPLFDSGRLLAIQRKLSPTERELLTAGISPGTETRVVAARGVRFATLVCADVLERGRFARLGERGVDFILVPTLSPLRAGEPLEAKRERDHEIFLEGARAAQAVVVKACGIGSLFGGRLQGRSLIVAPEGFLARVPISGEQRPRLLWTDVKRRAPAVAAS